MNEAEKRAQRFYQSCMDVNKTRMALDGKPLRQLLDLIGGWPAIATDLQVNNSEWNFQQSLQTAHNVINTDGFFKWSVSEDDKISSRYIIKVSFFMHMCFYKNAFILIRFLL